MPRLLSLLVAVVVILAGIISSLPLWREKAVQKKQYLMLQEELRQEQALSRDLAERINAVKTDPRTVERLAREKFGLARSGETIFKFRSDLPPPTRCRPPTAPPPRPNPPARGPSADPATLGPSHDQLTGTDNTCPLRLV